MAGWPAHAVISLAGKPGRRLERRIPNEANLRDLPPQHTFIRVANVDPLPASLDVGGAGIVSRHDLRKVVGAGLSERSLVSTKFQVWGQPARRIQPGGSRDWRKRARWVPNASGANANSANSVKDTPPAMRKTPARELLIFFRLLAKLVSLQRYKPTGRWDSPGWPTRVPSLRRIPVGRKRSR